MSTRRYATRNSKRTEGDAYNINSEINCPTLSRELKALSLSGGYGGKFDERESNTWTLTPEIEEELPNHNSNESNEDSDHEREIHECKNQIFNTRHLQDCINDKCVCKCALDTDLDRFVQYCCDIDNQICKEKLKELSTKWKH